MLNRSVALAGDPAAVCRQNGAADVVRLVRGEKHGRLDMVLGLPPLAQRDLLPEVAIIASS